MGKNTRSYEGFTCYALSCGCTRGLQSAHISRVIIMNRMHICSLMSAISDQEGQLMSF
eukprot:c35564_g1_i1 orf=3-173(-)